MKTRYVFITNEFEKNEGKECLELSSIGDCMYCQSFPATKKTQEIFAMTAIRGGYYEQRAKTLNEYLGGEQ